jgi:hypothetical protein
MVRRAMLVAAGLMVGPLWATASSAPAAERPGAVAAIDPFGVNGGALWPDGHRLLPTARHAAAIGRSGLRSVRAIAYWNLAEPTAPNPRTGEHDFDWTRTDAMAENLANNGLRWDVLLGFSSPWGGVVPGTTVGAPKPKPFAEYAAAVARRYGRGGDFWRANRNLPHVPIVNYQVWNEPNLPGITSIEAGPYANLYLATRAAILGVDLHARVAVAGLVHSSPSGGGNAVAYLQEMFRARPDLAGNVDAVGLTIYRHNPQEVMTQLAGARRALDELGERSTPIDIDETGWATRGGVLVTDILPISEEQRASFFTELVALVARSDCGLGVVSPFAWVTSEDNPSDASAWFGLADRQTANLKPSGAAYATAAQAAAGTAAPAPPSAPVCGRPDLPRLLQHRPPERVPFAVTLTRRCSARRLIVRYTLGPDPEPFRHFEISIPGSTTVRKADDPDGGGPLSARTTLSLRLPRRTGVVTVLARDELRRVRANGRARLAACRTRPR